MSLNRIPPVTSKVQLKVPMAPCKPKNRIVQRRFLSSRLALDRTDLSFDLSVTEEEFIPLPTTIVSHKQITLKSLLNTRKTTNSSKKVTFKLPENSKRKVADKEPCAQFVPENYMDSERRYSLGLNRGFIIHDDQCETSQQLSNQASETIAQIDVKKNSGSVHDFKKSYLLDSPAQNNARLYRNVRLSNSPLRTVDVIPDRKDLTILNEGFVLFEDSEPSGDVVAQASRVIVPSSQPFASEYVIFDDSEPMDTSEPLHK